MSLKSREKSIQRQRERQENIFAKQKAAAATAKKRVADYLYAALLLAVLTVLLAVLTKDDPEDMRNFWCAMPILAVIMLWLLLGFLRRRYFLRAMEKVMFSGKEKREFVCRRVRLVTYPVSRFGSEFAGLVLIAQGGKKYRYVFPQPPLNCREERKRWRKRYVGKTICCTCYRDTDIIKELNEM